MALMLLASSIAAGACGEDGAGQGERGGGGIFDGLAPRREIAADGSPRDPSSRDAWPQPVEDGGSVDLAPFRDAGADTRGDATASADSATRVGDEPVSVCDARRWQSALDAREATTGADFGRFFVTRGWSSVHMGVDVALKTFRTEDATGTPVYAIGPPGSTVEVRCWYEPVGGQNASTHASGMDIGFDYAHLSDCIAGRSGTAVVRAGDRVGAIGNTGAATNGPHLHFQQRAGVVDANPVRGTHVRGQRGYVRAALFGVTPCPPIGD
jgi:murein DD-endopeptidase MepM/ murein hydrolase activator NlpD